MSGVLVTSASTPLGHRLVQRLLETRSDIVLAVAAEREPPAELGSPNDRLVYECADLTRERDTRTLLFGVARTLGIDTVVHTSLHRSATDSGHRVHALNVESTRLLLDLSELHPTIRHFVFRSHADVYRIDPRRPVLIGEADPLDLSPAAPQRVRDRVEADLTVCSRFALSKLGITVLRCAEVLAAKMGSQLFDYLESLVCVRPLGFDPMLNLITVEDAVEAMLLAISSNARGVFNVPGADTLPLSRVIRAWGRRDLPLPGPWLAPLYRARASLFNMEFRYDMNHRRFHFSAVLDGRRARDQLGYLPRHPTAWPHFNLRAEQRCSGSLPGRT